MDIAPCRIEVRLKPRAKNNRIALNGSGVVEVAVTSPPVDDRANEHLIELLSRILGVPKRAISIIKGHHSRNKVAAIEGMTAAEVIRKISAVRSANC